MKKVLFVTYFWPPSGKASLHWPLDMIKYLPESNWHPALLTAQDDTFSQRDESFLEQIDPTLLVLKTKSLEPFNFYKRFIGKNKSDTLIASETISNTKKGIRHKLAVWIRLNLFIPDARVGWYFHSVVEGRKFLTGNYFDAIVSIGPPHTSHLIAKRLSKMFGISHYPVFIDPWTDIVYYQKLERSKLAAAVDNYFEKSVLLNAKKIVFVTKAMRESYIKKFPWVEQKSQVLYWGYNEESFNHLLNAKRTPKLGEENLKRDEEILLHAGNIFDYQNPLELWKYIKRVTESKRKIKIKFIGTVAPAIKNSLNDLGLSNQVEYVGFLSYSEMIAELYNADYLMVCASEPRHVPGKLFEYLRTRKPIIAFGDENAEIKQILTDANAGMLFNYSQDGHEFFETASKFSTDLSYIKQFDRREIAHQLATIMN